MGRYEVNDEALAAFTRLSTSTPEYIRINVDTDPVPVIGSAQSRTACVNTIWRVLNESPFRCATLVRQRGIKNNHENN